MVAQGSDAGVYEPRKPRDQHEGAEDLLLFPFAPVPVAKRPGRSAIFSTSSRSRRTATATRSSFWSTKTAPPAVLGTDSCFNDRVFESSRHARRIFPDGLFELLKGKKRDLPAGSYTTYLFQKGLDKILKKVGEESTEVIIAAKAEDRKETVYEIADLAYHLMVLMVEQGISTDEIRKERRLAPRHRPQGQAGGNDLMHAGLHNHTNFADGAASAEDMIRAAIEKGCTAIGFSEHSETPFDPPGGMKSGAFPSYRAIALEREVSRQNRDFPRDRAGHLLPARRPNGPGFRHRLRALCFRKRGIFFRRRERRNL